MLREVGIAEMYVSSNPGDCITAHSIGSCLAVSVYDHVAKVGGVMHSMLPVSNVDPQKAIEKPCMFTDTGITVLLKKIFGLGGTKENLSIKVAGAASPLNQKGFFKVGERSYTILEKFLSKNDLTIESEDVKGTVTKTLTLYINTGKTTVKTGDEEIEL